MSSAEGGHSSEPEPEIQYLFRLDTPSGSGLFDTETLEKLIGVRLAVDSNSPSRNLLKPRELDESRTLGSVLIRIEVVIEALSRQGLKAEAEYWERVAPPGSLVYFSLADGKLIEETQQDTRE
jgi:hypothetical protein